MVFGPSTGQAGTASRVRGALLLADISGYTGFLQGVGEAHQAIVLDSPEPPPAYALMSSLLETIMASLIPPFRLAKLEGDAVFAVAADGDLPIRGAAIVACFQDCHAAFAARLAEAIAGQDEVLGPDVNVAHRLLKNHALEVSAGRPYALMTDAALAALGVPAVGMLPSTETYDHLPPIKVHVLPLG